MFDVSNHQTLVNRLRAVGAPPTDAEDCAQEALVETWLARQRGVALNDPMAWATTIARRRYADVVRHERRQRARRPAATEDDRTAATPEEQIVERDHARWLARCVTDLPAGTRQVCELSGAGHTQKAIAERLGVSERAAESHLTRARRHLRRKAALCWTLGLPAGWSWLRSHGVASVTTAAAVGVSAGFGVVSDVDTGSAAVPAVTPPPISIRADVVRITQRTALESKRPLADGTSSRAHPQRVMTDVRKPEPLAHARVRPTPVVRISVGSPDLPDIGVRPQDIKRDVDDVVDELAREQVAPIAEALPEPGTIVG